MKCPKTEPVEGAVALAWRCRRDAGHAGPCAASVGVIDESPLTETAQWEACGAVEPTIDTYPDGAIRCRMPRDHDGPHRMEWR